MDKVFIVYLVDEDDCKWILRVFDNVDNALVYQRMMKRELKSVYVFVEVHEVWK